jgi:hypothetical protein
VELQSWELGVAGENELKATDDTRMVELVGGEKEGEQEGEYVSEKEGAKDEVDR